MSFSKTAADVTVRVHIQSDNRHLRQETRLLLTRMLSPLCGLNQRLNFALRGELEPQFFVMGAELTGVHVVRNQPRPPSGIYHIGGTGVFLDEAVIRSLGETIERYSQMIYELHRAETISMATYKEIAASGERVIGREKLRFFSEEQYAQPGFPFNPFSEEMPIGWVTVSSLTDGLTMRVPAQLVLVGYTIREAQGERWLLPAVTTGTAAHTDPELALFNALLELIHIDAAMGHWYSSATAPRIVLDRRTRPLERLIAKQFDASKPAPEFYWLSSPDFPAIVVACLLREHPGIVPGAAVGLGGGLTLVDAMYKALLEATGVAQLAKINLLDQTVGERAERRRETIPERIYDLDENVAFHALPQHRAHLDTKFSLRSLVDASDLPADSTLSVREAIRLLARVFLTTDKELFFLDLTPRDARDLGFTTLRVWSPDTLSLCLPSAPPVDHPRFAAYGGCSFAIPHPYP